MNTGAQKDEDGGGRRARIAAAIVIAAVCCAAVVLSLRPGRTTTTSVATAPAVSPSTNSGIVTVIEMVEMPIFQTQTPRYVPLIRSDDPIDPRYKAGKEILNLRRGPSDMFLPGSVDLIDTQYKLPDDFWK